jgi:importin subunit alpha-2
MGALKPMCNLLNSKDSKTIIVVLEGLNNILSAAAKLDQAERVAIMIEECGGLDAIEALQSHDNEKVYERALHIIETYFADGDADEMTANVANGQIQFAIPNMTDQQQTPFSF